MFGLAGGRERGQVPRINSAVVDWHIRDIGGGLGPLRLLRNFEALFELLGKVFLVDVAQVEVLQL